MAYLSIKEGRTASAGNKGRKLTPKMLSFINMYFGKAGFNATKAYQMSDYSDTKTPSENAAELLNHPLVAAEIKRRLDAREKKSEIEADYLVQKLIKIIENTEDDNPQAALRAIELAGKTIALWKDRTEISGPDGEAIKHEQHVKESVADFTSRIAGLAKRAGTANVVEFPQSGSAG